MKVVFPDEEGPAMAMMRTRPRRERGREPVPVARVVVAVVEDEPAPARREPPAAERAGGGQEGAHPERVELAAGDERHGALPASRASSIAPATSTSCTGPRDEPIRTTTSGATCRAASRRTSPRLLTHTCRPSDSATVSGATTESAKSGVLSETGF